MTNTLLLREAIDKSGLKHGYISDCLGITYQAFLNKINNKTEFKASEILTLSKILRLSVRERNDIFFAVNVDK